MKVRKILFIEDDQLDFEMYDFVCKRKFPSLEIIQMVDIDPKTLKKLNPNDTIIVLDINLNGKNGIDVFLEHLKKYEFFVFVFTSSDNPDDISKCYDAGIKYYFQKKSGQDQISLGLQNFIYIAENNMLKPKSSDKENYENLIYDINEQDSQIKDLNKEISTLKEIYSFPLSETSPTFIDQGSLAHKISEAFVPGVYVFNLSKRTNTFMNTTYQEITGYDLDEINSLNADQFLDLFHPDDKELVTDHMNELIASSTDQIYPIEYRFRHKNGHWIKLLSLDKVFSRDSEGHVESFIGCFFES